MEENLQKEKKKQLCVTAVPFCYGVLSALPYSLSSEDPFHVLRYLLFK